MRGGEVLALFEDSNGDNPYRLRGGIERKGRGYVGE
jgi:hypothetical protein